RAGELGQPRLSHEAPAVASKTLPQPPTKSGFCPRSKSQVECFRWLSLRAVQQMIRPATADDIHTISVIIHELAEYERLAHEVVLDENGLRDHLFGLRPFAEVLLAEESGKVVGFALFFHNYSTFLGKPGIYLEDLYVRPEHRGRGHGKE